MNTLLPFFTLITSITIMFADTQTEKAEIPTELQHPLIRMKDVQTGTLVFRDSEDPNLLHVLPNLETQANIHITGAVETTTINQVFTNTGNFPIEAIYVFPLPENGAVHDMKMLINDRLIQGVIKEKEEAKIIYEKAKKEGKRASLTEQQRPNIFTNSVANIMPGDVIIIRLEYIAPVQYEDGVFSLRFPTVVAPRFIPGNKITGYSGNGWAQDTDIVPDASKITPPVLPKGYRDGHNISITVTLDSGLPIDDVNCESHYIITEKLDENIYQISLKNNVAIPNRDFVLDYTIKQGFEPQAALFTAVENDEHYFMLMAVPPKQTSQTILPKEMVFIIDVSGSMSGESIGQAKQGLEQMVQSLRKDDYFNIIAFDDENYLFKGSTIKATKNNKAEAFEFIYNLKAMGGTNAHPALRLGMQMMTHNDLVNMVIFLTDGSVGNEKDLINLVHWNINNSRLFPIGIGSAPNSFLLRKIAREGRGTFTYISTTSQVESKISELFHKIEQPALTDLQLHIEGSPELFPNPIPDLFIGEPLFVVGKMQDSSDKPAILTGRTPEGYIKLSIELNTENASKDPAIPTIWARAKISQLMEEYWLGDRNKRDEVLKLALDYQLLTQFTSFVAVEHKIVNPEGKSMKSAIPTHIPKGWDFEKVFADAESSINTVVIPKTGSSAPLFGIIGMLLILLAGSLARFVSVKEK